jgi:hypothetical protein
MVDHMKQDIGGIRSVGQISDLVEKSRTTKDRRAHLLRICSARSPGPVPSSSMEKGWWNFSFNVSTYTLKNSGLHGRFLAVSSTHALASSGSWKSIGLGTSLMLIASYATFGPSANSHDILLAELFGVMHVPQGFRDQTHECTPNRVRRDFLAPELRQHRAELVSIRGELVSVRSELTTQIEAAESRLDSKIEALRSEFHAMQAEMRSGFSALGAGSKTPYFVASYLQPAKSPSSVSALNDWKKNAVKCLSS